MATDYVLLVTGSRTWSDYREIERHLCSLSLLFGENLIVRHGDCPDGADNWAKQICDHHGIRQDAMPADWNQYGKRAGFIRNAQMVEKDPKPNLCFAYAMPCNKPGCKVDGPHSSHGVDMCAKLAEDSGIYVRRFEIDE